MALFGAAGRRRKASYFWVAKLKISMNHLTLEQRYQISDLLSAGYSRGHIAEQVGVHKSTISRELSRNSDRRNGDYRPELAQRKRDVRQRAKPKRKRFTAGIEAYVKGEAQKGPEPRADRRGGPAERCRVRLH